MKSFKQKLIDMNACDDAVKWVGRKGLKRSWQTCERGDWMLWLAGRIDIDRKLLVLAACDCAEQALKHVPEGEGRSAEAIRVARLWCEGKAGIKEIRKAADAAAYAACAADAAADAAYAAYAADAADAAAYAACAADAAAYAACAADAAADAACLKTSAELVRKRIPFEVIERAMQ